MTKAQLILLMVCLLVFTNSLWFLLVLNLKGMVVPIVLSGIATLALFFMSIGSHWDD